jgi:hypothetical protein
MNIETTEMLFLRRTSGYAITDHVRNMTIRNTLQMYAFEGTIQDDKPSGVIASYKRAVQD